MSDGSSPAVPDQAALPWVPTLALLSALAVCFALGLAALALCLPATVGLVWLGLLLAAAMTGGPWPWLLALGGALLRGFSQWAGLEAVVLQTEVERRPTASASAAGRCASVRSPPVCRSSSAACSCPSPTSPA